jgi:uncharacterized protein (TIGR02270 family)
MENEQTGIDRVTITGIGLATSLGLSAPSSLAAIRGGIANFSEHETVMVNGDKYGTELCGARIARLPENIVSWSVSCADRAVALLAPALRECTDGISRDMLESAHWRICNRIEPEHGNFTDKLKAKLHDMPIPAMQYDDVASALGRCLFFEDIIQAVADLHNGSCQMALVGCVDSLCVTTVLDRLCEANRLKSGTNPEGFVAGEAAGVILLELESHARRRNATVHAYITAWGRDFEEHPLTGTKPSKGKGLSNAFREAFAQLPGKGEEIDMVIADLNGECARAYEWGYTAGRIFPIDDKVRELKHPADCTGDCGAAMGMVLLATAAGLFSGALPPLKIALSTSDDGDARYVLCLEKGDNRLKEAVIRSERKKCLTTLPAVIDQHKDEASFLWLLRNRLTKAPHYGLDELARHDERIEAHLDGLRLAGETGLEMCKEALESDYAEEIFSAAVLAFESGNEDRIQDVTEAAQHDQNKTRALISALGWLPYEQAEPHIEKFLADESSFHRYIGIAASAIHRHDPGYYLDKAVADDDPLLKARALRAYGELGRSRELNPCSLREGLTADDDGIRFSAAWSATLAGNSEAVKVMKSFVVPNSPYKEKALNTALRRMELAGALALQKHLADTADTVRLAVIGVGMIGDPVLVPWLIEQMKTPVLARVAGEAFTMITGVDIEHEEMKGTRPEGFNAGPNDDPNDYNVAMDADENLPWPNVELIAEWWDKHKGALKSGTHHLLGKPVTADHLRHVLKTGRQRQRAAAALELAIMQPGRPLFEVRAPGFRQIQVIRLKAEGE